MCSRSHLLLYLWAYYFAFHFLTGRVIPIFPWHVWTRNTKKVEFHLRILFYGKATGAQWGKITDWNPKYQSIFGFFLFGKASQYRVNINGINANNLVQHREGRSHFSRLNPEDIHNDAFAFFTLQYRMSLNSSAFIYWERWNNVTPKSSSTASWACAQHEIMPFGFMQINQGCRKKCRSPVLIAHIVMASRP